MREYIMIHLLDSQDADSIFEFIQRKLNIPVYKLNASERKKRIAPNASQTAIGTWVGFTCESELLDKEHDYDSLRADVVKNLPCSYFSVAWESPYFDGFSTYYESNILNNNFPKGKLKPVQDLDKKKK